MIEFFAAISIGGACFSCFCAYQTWKMCGAIRDIEDRRISNMANESMGGESVRYDPLETTTAEPQKGEISYPKYREYGDLS